MTPERLLILILVIVIAGLLVVIYRLRRESRRIWLGLDEVAEDTLKALHNLSSPLAPGIAPELAVAGGTSQAAGFARCAAPTWCARPSCSPSACR